MKKKLLVVLTVMALVVTMLATTAFAISGTITGAGTESDPYKISDAADLKALATAVNGGESYEGKYFVLAGDITLSDAWIPIGNGERDGNTYTGNSFKGNFDGKNFTISGLAISGDTYDTVGLFGVLDGATVKNIKFTNVDINVGKKNAGTVAGISVNDTLIQNITVSGAVTAADGVGGVLGRMIISGRLYNCTNNATVTATAASGDAGGIVGKAYYTGTTNDMLDIYECVNNGAIESGYAAGGIAGLSAAFISKCENNATIKSAVEAGGIVGEQTMYGQVFENVNNGEIKNNTTGGTAYGGIIGWVRYANSTTDYPTYATIVVADNVNNGNITASGAALGSGGIVGHVYNQVVVSGNENYATAITGGVFSAGVVGGIQDAGGNVVTSDNAVLVSNNISKTAISAITGNCVDEYGYDNDTSRDVVIDNAEKWFAEIDGVKYATLNAAINAADDGDTVKLLDNITGTETIIVDASIILDLNGKTIENTADNVWVVKIDGNSVMTLVDNSAEGNGTITGYKGISVVQGSELIMNGGKVDATGTASGSGIQIYGSKATLNGGTIKSAYGSVLMYSNNDVRGTFIMTGGKIEAPKGISANGSEAWDNVDATISGGEVVCETLAVYWPAAGKLTISGGKFSGRGAVYVKSGSVEITGGEFIATGAKSGYEYNNSGAYLTGDAIVIETIGGSTGYEAVESVVISGGTFTSENADAVASYAATTQNPSAEKVENIISGGTFSSDVSDLVVEGAKTEANNGFFGIVPDVKGDTVAVNGNIAYDSLQKALDAAENGDTVKLVANIEISNGIADKEMVEIKAGKKVTLDLNGHTISQYIKDPGLSIAAVVVRPGAELTIMDSSAAQTGKITSTKTTVQLSGTLNLVSGTLACDVAPTAADIDASFAYNIWFYIPAGSGATPVFNMTGGKLELADTQAAFDYPGAISVDDEYGTDAFVANITVNISAGVIEGEFFGLEGADAEVTGGTFTTDVADFVPAGYALKKVGNEYVAIRATGLTAGTYTTDPTGYLAPNYYAVNNGDGTWTVYYNAPFYSDPTYNVTVNAPVNGTVVADTATAFPGTKVTVYTAAFSGYKVESIKVTTASGRELDVVADGTIYTFMLPDADVTVDVKFSPVVCDGGEYCDAKVFTDVNTKEWYHAAIDYVAEVGIMQGYPNGAFGVDDTIIRAQVVQMLYNLAGKPVAKNGIVFSDANVGDWYYDAMMWASSVGIVTGYGDGTCGALDNITREQLAVMIYRYEQYVGGGFKGVVTYTPANPDIALVSDWAYEAMAWCVMNKVVEGYTNGNIDPQGTATRAQAAQMFYNYANVK